MIKIILDNKDSYKDFGLYLQSKPNIPIAEENIDTIDVEGRNGSLYERYGTYKDIEIEITFTAITPSEIYRRLSLIKAWLQDFKDNKLSFSDDPDYFYMLNYVKFSSNIANICNELGTFTATFICKPFKYSKAGLEKITLTNHNFIINYGTAKAYPIIKVYGQGDLTLMINGNVLYLYGIKDSIIINSQLQEAYSDNMENLNLLMQGEFPFFYLGKNDISWSYGIDKIEITPNWAYL